jgi:REP element-mobilizing transposase RayT
LGDMSNGQLALFGRPSGGWHSLEHGGDVRKGRRKLARPLDTKRLLHIVLRSSRARREWSMLRPALAERISLSARGLARRFGVRLYRYANVGNHIHLLARARSRPEFQAFLRGFAGVTARLVTGARRGRRVGRFWDRLAYSRVVSWGREYRTVSAYVQQNENEARGGRGRTTRAHGRALRRQTAPHGPSP